MSKLARTNRRQFSFTVGQWTDGTGCLMKLNRQQSNPGLQKKIDKIAHNHSHEMMYYARNIS